MSTTSARLKSLTPPQCILLAVHFACTADIKSLSSLTPARPDVLDPALVLRILLTYLPESTEPSEYIGYAEAVASQLDRGDERTEETEVDTQAVAGKGEREARKVVQGLRGLEAGGDLLARFLVCRARRIEEETGMVGLIPGLVGPFLGGREGLRTWFVACVLPVLRLEGGFYAASAVGEEVGVRELERVSGREGVDLLLGKAERGVPPVGEEGAGASRGSVVARDVRGLVGPWMYGHSARKRRKLGHDGESEREPDVKGWGQHVRKISRSGGTNADKTGHDWECFYAWLVQHARNQFDLVSQCIKDWDGPADVDLGGYGAPGEAEGYLDEDLQRKLELQYAQAAFAACYAVEADSEATVKGAHGILARLAELLEFIPPPDLATSVDALPRIERHATRLDESRTIKDLSPEALLEPEHPLTTPRMETYMLLQMIVYSAYHFSVLGHPMSLVSVAKLQFCASAEEQLEVLRRILRSLVGSGGGKRDETMWASDRGKIVWLWNWGIDQEDEGVEEGPGVLGKVGREVFEREMLGVFTETGCYGLPIQLYLKSNDGAKRLSKEKVEDVVLGKAMEAYDGASNGNRSRGGVKRAADIIAAFQPYFRESIRFRQATALIAATHSLSFYSLTLQHGVPFQPVSIRVTSDPIGLVEKVLEQNARSYTQLDDLISIAQNLVTAGLQKPSKDEEEVGVKSDGVREEREKKEAERRVTFMAVEAALRGNDFETAYSYIVNRLTPSNPDIPAPTAKRENRHKRIDSHSSTAPNDDDISWRAAFLAGRYRGSSSSTSSSPPTLRRLEQRTELLSLALLLAPTSALTEILAAWRRCEEETVAAQNATREEERAFDDRADKRLSGSGSAALPGNFVVGGEQPELVRDQRRRELGRFGGTASRNAASEGGGGRGGRGGEEAPMSMFDLTRSAASAFSRGVGAPMRASSTAGGGGEGQRGGRGEGGELQRVRKRDMVASAVSGGLASGLGWVLGATPVERGEGEET